MLNYSGGGDHVPAWQGIDWSRHAAFQPLPALAAEPSVAGFLVEAATAGLPLPARARLEIARRPRSFASSSAAWARLGCAQRFATGSATTSRPASDIEAFSRRVPRADRAVRGFFGAHRGVELTAREVRG